MDQGLALIKMLFVGLLYWFMVCLFETQLSWLARSYPFPMFRRQSKAISRVVAFSKCFVRQFDRIYHYFFGNNGTKLLFLPGFKLPIFRFEESFATNTVKKRYCNSFFQAYLDWSNYPIGSKCWITYLCYSCKNWFSMIHFVNVLCWIGDGCRILAFDSDFGEAFISVLMKIGVFNLVVSDLEFVNYRAFWLYSAFRYMNFNRFRIYLHSLSGFR